jgi:hypothetical protein
MGNFRIAVAATAALATFSSAKELSVNMELKAEIYDSGLVHEQIMALKHVRLEALRGEVPRGQMTNSQTENLGRDGRPGRVRYFAVQDVR